MEYLVRLFVSAGLIVAVSEAGKVSPRLGGLLASLPLVSYIGMIWLYADTRDKARIAQFSQDVFWLVLPSLALFATLPWLLKRMSFAPALAVGTLLMLASYGGMLWLLRQNA